MVTIIGAVAAFVQIKIMSITASVGSVLNTTINGFKINANGLLNAESIAHTAARAKERINAYRVLKSEFKRAIQNELSAKHEKNAFKVCVKDGTI